MGNPILFDFSDQQVGIQGQGPWCEMHAPSAAEHPKKISRRDVKIERLKQ